MKILFINTGPWGTGSFTVIKGLAKQLLEIGHEVKIFFPDAQMQTVDMHEYYHNPELYHIWNFPISNGKVTLPTFPLMLEDPHPRNPYPILFKCMSDDEIDFYLSELRKEISELIQAFKPTVIECHHIWYASWVLAQLGEDFIVTAHHSDQLGFHIDKKVQPYAINAAKAAKKIIAISEPVKQEVLQLYHVPDSKVMVCDNGYDKDIFYPQTIDKQAVLDDFELTINPEALIINMVGKLSINKGVDILLQANHLLDEGLDIHILVLGAGDLNPILNAVPSGTCRIDNVHFLGHQSPERVADIHNISRLSVMPSRSEGFGVACLEAMACGVPVVVSKSGGPEFFAVGQIMEENTAQHLAQAINDLVNMSDPNYQALRQKALEVAQGFSWESITKKHLALYQSILTENGGA